MFNCLLLHRSYLSDTLLEHYIRRTGCLDLTWTGSYSSEAVQEIRSGKYDLVFVSLPEPHSLLPESLVTTLRHCKSLVLSSLYPEHLYAHYRLERLHFLTEPFPAQQFQQAIEKYIALAESGY
ncbi:type 2 periplasmic-binding domain-containing protein [Siphonobacter curvatus]|uniref:Response regulatory domain-containing protein n=1 Tax=Siphonobacter curvatus TaxID=2094562 RepID=A0A2S7IH36_9BACT|nr:hypothetical protein [Siphonobacter curvatus]PQA55112.1 hypothetical protein C5O19_21460 [Siphonobacter curvatus]